MEEDPNAYNKYSADSAGDSRTWMELESESVSESSTLVPVLGKELAHVQFRNLDEQLARAMAVLFDQQERHGVARLVGMSAPVSLYTPDVSKMPSSEERVKNYLHDCYAKLPFALSKAESVKQIADKEAKFSEEILGSAIDEPTSARQRIK